MLPDPVLSIFWNSAVIFGSGAMLGLAPDHTWVVAAAAAPTLDRSMLMQAGCIREFSAGCEPCVSLYTLIGTAMTAAPCP
jgi:hypothetical protein